MDEEVRVLPGKLLFVDLEFTHVTSAVYELAYILHMAGCDPLKRNLEARKKEMQRAFLEAYLTAMGDPAIKEDVDALLVDVCLANMTSNFEILSPWSPNLRSWLKNFKSAMAELLASAEAQQLFLQENGVSRWVERVQQMPPPSSGWISDWKPKGNATANHSVAKAPCLGKGKGPLKRGN